MEEVQMYLDEAKDLMDKAVQHTAHEFSRIRAGKATPKMLEGVSVDYYGVKTPLTQMSAVSAPDPRSLVVKPFEKNMVGEVVKAIRNANLGLNPSSEADLVRINIPPLSEERRRDLVKQAKSEAENGKISVRTVRKDTNNALKDLQKDGVPEDAIKRAEDQVQTLTNEHTDRIDALLTEKESEIMTV